MFCLTTGVIKPEGLKVFNKLKNRWKSKPAINLGSFVVIDDNRHDIIQKIGAHISFTT